MLIIGNGPSVLNQKSGDLVDSFNEVVRFNNYKIDGFEDFVGAKTTHWWNVVNFSNLQHPHLLRDYQEVCLHSWQFNKQKDKFWARISPCLKADNILKSSESWIFEMQQFIGNKYYSYSTGLLAIWHYLKERDCVTIHGFDLFCGEKHHYGDNEIRGTIHSHDYETLFIKKLRREKRIEFLV